jgi:hypothetical protein
MDICLDKRTLGTCCLLSERDCLFSPPADTYKRSSNNLLGGKYKILFFSWQKKIPLLYHKHMVKYGIRSPKFIWAPCEQLYSFAETPHL